MTGSPEIGRLIRERRIEAGWTQEALAERIGCSKGQLSLMESGRRSVSPDRARRIEAALGIEDGRLAAAARWQRIPPELRAELEASRDASQRLHAELRDALRSRRPTAELRRIIEQAGANIDAPRPAATKIPVINKIAAGYPTEFTDLDYPASIADEYIACPDVTDPQAFAARVVGDSMEPEYREGEIVVFSPSRATPSGSDCFIRLERDNETTFKRVYFEDESRRLRLQPLNPKYPPRVVDREDVTGLWAAAYVMRQVRGE